MITTVKIFVTRRKLSHKIPTSKRLEKPFYINSLNPGQLFQFLQSPQTIIQFVPERKSEDFL